uniref:Odorant receptor 6 n=1 Tax=Eucryptorrhynchus scrobiculatus TaxID=1552824 RepID=A0A8F4MWT8_EUCSC|nr:odorant receptor 6 [Eucryptorrhynchus scrobiculatus]
MGSIYVRSKFFMLITGLWMLPFTDNPILRKFYKIYSVLLHSVFGMFSVSLMIRFVELVTEGAKSDTLFGSLTLTIILTMMIYKILIYLKNGIPYLFYQVVDEEGKYLNSSDEEIRSTYLKQATYFKWTTSIQIMCTFFTVAMFIISNIYKMITHSFKPGEVFMYEVWAPFDKVRYDMFISVFNVCMVTIGFFNNVAVATAPQSLMVFLTAQLRILQIRIRKVFISSSIKEQTVIFKVKELIRQHQNIIKFATKLNDGIKNIIFIEYILASVNVAAALLHILTLEFSGEMIFSIFHFLLLLVQIFILAFTAQEINTQVNSKYNRKSRL